MHDYLIIRLCPRVVHLGIGLVLFVHMTLSAPSPSNGADRIQGYLLDRALSAIAMERRDLSIPPDLFSHPFTFRRFKRWMENPTRMPLEVQIEARALLDEAENPLQWFLSLASLGDVSIPLHPLSQNTPAPALPSHLPKELVHPVSELLGAMRIANGIFGHLLRKMSPHDMHLIEKYLYPCRPRPGGEDQETNEESTLKELKQALHATGNVEREAIFDAGRIALKAVVKATKFLQEPDLKREVRSFSFMTELGRVVIGGTGADVHTGGDATLIIDLGGDDLYRGQVAHGEKGRCAVVIDLKGNDTYVGKHATQASGFWGAGILLDLEGNDLYKAEDCSQGAGFFGVGVLIDMGGMDRYIGGKFVQAASLCGWGGMLDTEGEDTYQSVSFGQAYSGILGVSCLSDIQGHDRYLAGTGTPDPREPDMNQSFAQGFSMGMRNLAAGGLALLLDQSGNDLYQCQYFGQGSSYWMGIGILYDEMGKDTYLARRYAQGAGIHFSLGLLVDTVGDDNTVSWGVSQGCGHDYGIGILLNEKGNDTYVSNWLSLGASEANGVGIFIDNSGNDGYQTASGPAVGRLVEGRRAGGVALFVDAGGSDRYTGNGGNNTLWGFNRWSVGIDGNEDGISGLNLSGPENADPTKEGMEALVLKEKVRLADDLSRAADLPFPAKVSQLLSVASHWGFDRTLPEVAEDLLLKLNPEKSVPLIIEHLDTPDIIRLQVMERFFLVHASHAIPALMEKTVDPTFTIRLRAFYYLGVLKDTRALSHCIVGLSDIDKNVRAAAVRAIGEMMNRKRLKILIPMRDAFVETGAETVSLRDFASNIEMARMALSVLIRAVPLDYKTYKRYTDVSSWDEQKDLLEDYTLLLSRNRKEMTALLGEWVKDIGNDQSVSEKIMELLDDPEMTVQRNAAYALGQLGYQPAISPLLSMLNDPHLWLRDTAALSLSLYGDEVIGSLDEAMSANHSAFKMIALDVLARVKTGPSKSLVEKYLHDPDPNVARAARQALSRFPEIPSTKNSN